MSTNTTFSKVIWPGLPSRGRLLLAVPVASIGTAAYMLAPSLAWRESIPAITMLAGVGAYIGFRLAARLNVWVIRRLTQMTDGVDSDAHTQRMQTLAGRHPRRMFVFHWTVVAAALSYILGTYVVIPMLTAAVFTAGIGSLAEIDAAARLWAIQYGGGLGVVLLIVFTSLTVGFYFIGVRMLKAIYEHREHTGDPSSNGQGAAMQFESEIRQFIPGGLIHA